MHYYFKNTPKGIQNYVFIKIKSVISCKNNQSPNIKIIFVILQPNQYHTTVEYG